MRLLVTGGTGLVGSHTVSALVSHGHDIRLLVRAHDRIAPALRPLGLDAPVDYVVGDVTDQDSVERALEGCDAVIHAAAVYTLDSRAYPEISRTNLRGPKPCSTPLCGTAAIRWCISPASWPSCNDRPQSQLTPPLSSSPGVYVQSKAASEAVARRLQDDGAPRRDVQNLQTADE